MKGITILQQLLLQKPSKNSRAKNYSKHLLRRLDLGDLDALLREGTCIQQRLSSSHSSKKEPTLSQRFAKKMKKGNVQAALIESHFFKQNKRSHEPQGQTQDWNQWLGMHCPGYFRRQTSSQQTPLSGCTSTWRQSTT